MLTLRKAFKCSPEAGACYNAADGYCFFNMFEEAALALSEVPEDEVDSLEYCITRNRFLMSMKEWKIALHNTDVSLQLFPYEPEIIVQKAYILRQLGLNEESAREIVDSPAWMVKSGILHYNLACYEAIMGDPEVAVKFMDLAIEINPKMRKTAKSDPDLLSVV